MTLEDVYYFSQKKQLHPELFSHINKAVQCSMANAADAAEVQRRLNLLSRSKGNEHLRQASNFVAEAATYTLLEEAGEGPHWVPEVADKKMPDLEAGQHPVEVKHLNSPRVEHEALANGEMYGGSVDTNYDTGLDKKIGDFIKDTREKFTSYNLLKRGVAEPEGTLYLYFTKSIDAGIADGISWMTKMQDRIESIVKKHLLEKDRIALIVTDIDHILD